MNYIITLIVFFASFNLFNTHFSEPASVDFYLGEKVALIDNKQLSLLIDSDEMENYFAEAIFDVEKEELRFITREKVNKITIREGDKEKIYMLPVKSHKIKLGMSMFATGNYELIFELQGIEKDISTLLEVF